MGPDRDAREGRLMGSAAGEPEAHTRSPEPNQIARDYQAGRSSEHLHASTGVLKAVPSPRGAGGVISSKPQSQCQK